MHVETTTAAMANQRVFEKRRSRTLRANRKVESQCLLLQKCRNDISDHSLQASAGFATSHLLIQLVCHAQVYSHCATTADRVKLANLPRQSRSLTGAAQNKHSRLTKSPKGITMRGPSPLMSIHLVEAPGWLCTIYGTTKAKKASISTRMQPRMLVRFFRYLYI